MDGEYHPCTPSYKGPEKCNPAEHRTPEQVASYKLKAPYTSSLRPHALVA